MQILHYNNDFEIEKMCLRNWCALGKHLGSDHTSKKNNGNIRVHYVCFCLKAYSVMQTFDFIYWRKHIKRTGATTVIMDSNVFLVFSLLRGLPYT